MRTIFSGASRTGLSGHSMGAALAGLAVLIAMLPAAPAAADHTPVPQAVTLVGSLQEELGCPGDWQPECAATHLQPVDGQPGVFRGHVHGAGGRLRVQGRAERGVGRELRRGRQPRRCEHTADRARRAGHVHLRPRHPPDRRRLPQAAGQRRRRAVAAPRHHRLEPSRAERRPVNYRLYWAEEGGLAREDGQITGGESAPLTVRSGGLPADLRAQYPHLASYDALVVPDAAPAAEACSDRSGRGRLRRSRWHRRERHGPAAARRTGRPLCRGAQPHPRARPGTGAGRSLRCGLRPPRPSTSC